MTRRTHMAIVMAALSLVALAGSAEATTSQTRACLVASKRARLNCTNTCRSSYITNFEGCFGPGSACAAACLNDQATCQSGPATATAECKQDTLFCADGNQSGANGCTAANATIGQCGTILKSALTDCTDATKHPEGALVCAANARLDNLRCQDNCQLLFAPALDTCNQNFADCTGACASCLNPTDCPSPSHRPRY
jgi:hypothetical protein